jgi:hypothetical protein
MMDTKLIEFFEDVSSKTKEGKIQWEPTAQESTFIAAFGGRFSLSISSQADVETAIAHLGFSGGPLEKYTLVLRDMHGRIATVTERDEGDGGVRPGAMRELYETARWRAVHGGEKVNEALEALRSL